MPGSRGPTPADVRAMLRLSRTLHVASDPVTRKKHLLSGLCAMLDAASALCVIVQAETDPRRHTIVSVTRHGTPRLREEQLLSRCLPAFDLPEQAMRPGLEPQWRRVAWPVRAARTRQLCHCIWHPSPIGDARVVACISITRALGPAMGPRERMLLHLVHMEMSWVYESDLLLATHGAGSLSPRQRQTLEYLLAGLGEKQIAARMRLSPNTVHHHVKALHRYFGVSSRSELLARWVR